MTLTIIWVTEIYILTGVYVVNQHPHMRVFNVYVCIGRICWKQSYTSPKLSYSSFYSLPPKSAIWIDQLSQKAQHHTIVGLYGSSSSRTINIYKTGQKCFR